MPNAGDELGLVLNRMGDWQLAIVAYRDASRVDPKCVRDHYLLAAALEQSGDRVGEIAELREAIRLEQLSLKWVVEIAPETGEVALFDDCRLNSFAQGFLAGTSSVSSLGEEGYTALGTALAESVDVTGAIKWYSESIRIGNNKPDATTHAYLGNARRLIDDLPGEVAAYREAIRLKPGQLVESRYCLCITLAESGDVPGAIDAFRDAIQHEDIHQPSPFRLLQAVLMAPKPDEAVALLRHVHEHVRDDPTLDRAIAVALSQFEQLSKSGVQIPRIFRHPIEGGDLAQLCYDRHFFAPSAAIWSAGFAADPKLADEMQAQTRYNAACSAALAAAGKGIEKPPLDDKTKAHWRQQAARLAPGRSEALG